MRHLLPIALFSLLAACGNDYHPVTVEEAPPAPVPFDFVRNIDGSPITGPYWLGDASKVLPEEILDSIPADQGQNGTILFIGDLFSHQRFYLLGMPARSYCIIERPYSFLGQLDFVEDGYLVAVELATLRDMGLLEEILDTDCGVVVDSEKAALLDLNRWRLKIGAVIIRLFGRD